MSEEVNEVVRLCQEVIASLLREKVEGEDEKHTSYSSLNRNAKFNSMEEFLGWLDLEIAELKKMAEEYEKIDSEELSVDEIEKRLKDLKLRIEREKSRST